VYARVRAGIRFAFITHNTKDFSQQNASNKLRHPDIARYFSRIRSLYFINLDEALRRIEPAQFADLMMEQEWIETRAGYRVQPASGRTRENRAQRNQNSRERNVSH
jgi:hypothetical protein